VVAPGPRVVIAILTLLACVVAATLVRARATARARRAVAARLPVGPDGTIRGAAAIDLQGEGRGAVLLLHGFADTPQTLEYLADYIHSHGWAVRAPLLPGHGRTLPEFAASRADDWIHSARRELDALRERFDSVAIVGLSMGGSLATILAAERSDVQALVLLAPYLSMPKWLRRAAGAHRALGAVLPYLRGASERSIRDPSEAARNLAYGFTTPRLIFELATVVDRARAAAPRVTAPTLVIQSRQDNRIPPDAAERAFALFRATERRLIWTEGNGHIITVDYGRLAVFASTMEWLERYSARAAARSLASPAHGSRELRPRTA
jgi:carboxylesterase